MKKISALIINALVLFAICVGMVFVWPALVIILLYDKAEKESPLELMLEICVSLIIYWGAALYISGCR